MWGASTPTQSRCQLPRAALPRSLLGLWLIRGPVSVLTARLPVRFGARRVDPADIAVGPAVDDVHPSRGTVLEYQAGCSAEVEFHHRLADRHLLQRGRGLGDDHGAVSGDLVLVVTLARRFQHVGRGV